MNNPIFLCVDRNPLGAFDELVGAIAGLGFAGIEWFEVNEDAPWTNPVCAPVLRRLMRQHELTAQYHAPYEASFDLAVKEDAWRTPEEIAGVVSQALARAEALGARLMTLHLGTCPKDADRSEGLRRVAEGVRRALPEAARRGIRLALENHTPTVLEGPLGDRPEEMDWIMAALQSEWIGRTLDLGHAHIHGHLDAFLARSLDRVLNLHLHDNHGETDEHLPLGAGDVPWDRVLRQVARAPYNGPITLEFLAEPEQYEQAIELIRSCN